MYITLSIIVHWRTVDGSLKKIDFWWFSWIEKYGGAIDVMCRERERERERGGGGGVLRFSCASALSSLFSWLHQRHSSGLSQRFLLCLCLSREPLMLHLRHRCSGKRRKSKGFSKYISLTLHPEAVSSNKACKNRKQLKKFLWPLLIGGTHGNCNGRSTVYALVFTWTVWVCVNGQHIWKRLSQWVCCIVTQMHTARIPRQPRAQKYFSEYWQGSTPTSAAAPLGKPRTERYELRELSCPSAAVECFFFLFAAGAFVVSSARKLENSLFRFRLAFCFESQLWRLCLYSSMEQLTSTWRPKQFPRSSASCERSSSAMIALYSVELYSHTASTTWLPNLSQERRANWPWNIKFKKDTVRLRLCVINFSLNHSSQDCGNWKCTE